jgi:hypothetical protein
MLATLYEYIFFPLIALGTLVLVWFIGVKINEAKKKTDNETIKRYWDMLEDTITSCVISTTQTYVNSLKKEGKFDAEAQKIALQKTYDAIMGILTEDAKKYLSTVIGDLQSYVLNKIESNVAQTKSYLSF